MTQPPGVLVPKKNRFFNEGLPGCGCELFRGLGRLQVETITGGLQHCHHLRPPQLSRRVGWRRIHRRRGCRCKGTQGSRNRRDSQRNWGGRGRNPFSSSPRRGVHSPRRCPGLIVDPEGSGGVVATQVACWACTGAVPGGVGGWRASHTLPVWKPPAMWVIGSGPQATISSERHPRANRPSGPQYNVGPAYARRPSSTAWHPMACELQGITKRSHNAGEGNGLPNADGGLRDRPASEACAAKQ